MNNKPNCPTCIDNNMIFSQYTITTNWGNFSLDIVGIPGYKCSECNEVFIDSFTARFTQKLTKFISTSLLYKNIDTINVSELFSQNTFNSTNDQDEIINLLSENRLQIKRIGNTFRLTRTDVISALQNKAIDISSFEAIAARDGKKSESDIEKILHHLENGDNND